MPRTKTEVARSISPTTSTRSEVVTALGGFGAYVTDLAEVPAALHAAIASGKPACVNVIIDGTPAPVVT